MRALILVWFALATVLLVESHAFAQSCTLSTTGVSFGSYDVFGTVDTETTTSVYVDCTSSTPYEVALNAGVNSAGSYSSRKMDHTTDPASLNYNLYTNVARTQIWGDGTGSTTTVTGTGQGLGNTITHVVYALLPALQNVRVGTYSDTVTVTATY